jgi:predicted aspartyl protease
VPIINGPLTALGAVVAVQVGVHEARREVLERNNMPVPARQRVRAQIDTGTTFTAVDAQVLRHLNVLLIDRVTVRTSSPTGDPQVFNRYAVSVVLEAAGFELHLAEMLVLEAAFGPQDGIQALIGQDVLKHCLYINNGPQNSFSLAF